MAGRVMQKGDFIKIDYVGRLEATGEIFDLTIEQVARKEGIYNEKQKYGPALVIVGANMVVPGMESRLEQMKPGDEREFVLEPSEGFGDREPKLIKIMSLKQFAKQKMNPVPGMFVNINGRQAKVQSVSGGRVRVDFNHPLAGKGLKYKVKIVEKIDSPITKAAEMIKFYGIKAETMVEGDQLHVSTVKPLPEVIRKMIEGKITEWVKEIKKIKFTSKEKQKKDKDKEKEPKLGDVPLERPEDKGTDAKDSSAPGQGESKEKPSEEKQAEKKQ